MTSAGGGSNNSDRVAETIAGAGSRGLCGNPADLRYIQGYHHNM